MLLLADFVGAAIPVDGTNRLRAMKTVLDEQIKTSYISDPVFRARLKQSVRRQPMLPGSTVTAFQVFNFAVNRYEYRSGLLVAQGKHCNLFIESERANVFASQSAEVFAQIVDTFDNKVFPGVSDWFGEPQIPVSFNLPDERVYIFLVDIRDQFDEGYVAGYFDHRDIEGLFGNQKPVFFMDIAPGEPGSPDDKTNPFYRTLAHELQHMVNFSIRHANGYEEEERWLDEGFAMFSEYVFSGKTGKDSTRVHPSPHLERFLENPAVNILSNSKESWFHEDFLFRQYGASFLFVTYLIEKYGGNLLSMQKQFTREIVRSPQKGVAGIDYLLKSVGSGFDEAFCNFIMAIYVDEPAAGNGMWGFNDKTASFGKSAGLLPLRPMRHYASSGADSFIAADDKVFANCVNAEEINGIGSITLQLTCEKGITPYIAEISSENGGFIRPLRVDDYGHALINADFNKLRRFFILPIALHRDSVESQIFSYSFKSLASNLVIYPLPNPAFPDQFMIFLKSFSGPLERVPELKIVFANLLDSPSFEAVDASHTLFLANYQIPGDGQGQVTGKVGDDSCSFTFSAARLRENSVSVLEIASARLSASSVGNDEVVMIAEPDSTFLSMREKTLDGPYDIFVPDRASATFFFTAPRGNFQKSALCLYEDEKHPVLWQPFQKSAGDWSACVPKSGRYYVIQDDCSPLITNLSVKTAASGLPFLIVDALDDLSGISAGSVRVFVDDFPAALLPSDKLPLSIPLSGVSEGRHAIRVELKDNAGNKTSASIMSDVVLPVAVLRADVFPNPCRSRARIVVSFSGAPVFAETSLKIYDSSGHYVAALPLVVEGNGKLSAEWNLLNNRGERVSNGVYFFRSNITADAKKLKVSGKIAVLR
ncbi:MAG: hypothetical protein EOM80_10440 [Erysipelotrichia bacterium]|nr:hypothetical protein [Erysipelotrichia bacterium]